MKGMIVNVTSFLVSVLKSISDMTVVKINHRPHLHRILSDV